MLRKLLVLGLATLALGAACDERGNPIVGGVGGETGGSATFNVTPATLTLTTGQSAQLTLNSTRAIGPYTWSTSQSGVATVTQSGLVSAVGTGSATITVTAAADPAVSARATISVQQATTP